MRAAFIAVVLAVSSTAAAQPGASPPVTPPSSEPTAPPESQPPAPQPSSEPATQLRLSPPGLTQPSEPAIATTPLAATRKSRAVATLLSVGGTVAPVLMFVAAINIHDGDTGAHLALASFATMLVAPSAGHWYAGKTLTAGMGVRALGGTVATLSLMLLVASDGEMPGVEEAFWLGTITVGVGAIWDIATASSAVDQWNRKHATVMPTALKLGDGYGVGVVGRF